MPRLTAPLAALATLALAACSTSEDIASNISLETMQDVVRTLSSDEYEGRMPGTPGGDMAVAYLIEQFEAAGLQPGNEGSWVQDVPLVEITGSDFAPLTVGSQQFTYGEDWVGVSYRQAPTTTLADSELVFVGYGINAPERGWNDYEGVNMAGKTALILVNDPDFAADSLEGTFDRRAMTYYGRWTYKYEEAARQGAAAALIVHEDFAASYGWATVESSWSGAQSYADTGGDGSDQTLMNGWVSNDTARALFAAADMDLDAMVEAASQPGFEAVSLGAPVSTSFTNSARRYTSQNVIGVLPGSERPDEYVLHTAHWDHLGRCLPNDEGDDICNGAIDNATGTAALVALAEAHVAAGASERSLVFLAVTAEEQGLLGSEYYAANPVFPLAQTVGGINMDGIAITGETRDVSVRGLGKSNLDAILETALAAQGRSITPDPAPEAGYYYRSDHFPLAKRGVPMFYVKSGQDLVDGGSERGAALEAEYRAERYHGPDDEYDETWDWTGIMQDIDLYFRLGRALGNTDDWPEWNEGDEFRAIREQSCASTALGC